MSDHISELLRFDPLAAAEGVTGKSYKEDQGTMAIGFAMHLQHNERKRAALEAARDTHFSMPYAEACAVYERLGFEKVLTVPFEGRYVPEEMTLWWSPEGLLLRSETFSFDGERERGLNSSTVYYNLAIENREGLWSVTSSGSMREGGIWVGDHDAREGLAAKLDGLRSVGSFLPKWRARPWLWLLTYVDTDDKGYDHGAINEERIAALPQYVRDAIGDPK